MGIDLSCIVKNRFTDRRNPEACAGYIGETIEKLTNRYCVKEGAFDFEYHNYGGTFNTFSIKTGLGILLKFSYVKVCGITERNL